LGACDQSAAANYFFIKEAYQPDSFPWNSFIHPIVQGQDRKRKTQRKEYAMKKKDNKPAGAWIVFITFAVVVITAITIQHQTSTLSMTVPDDPIVIRKGITLKPETFSQVVLNEEETRTDVTVTKTPTVISFGKAFSIARSALGPNETFTWNGKQYSTNTAVEATDPRLTENRDIHLADANDSLDNSFSQAITPEF